LSINLGPKSRYLQARLQMLAGHYT